jgi:hypothetical protein
MRPVGMITNLNQTLYENVAREQTFIGVAVEEHNHGAAAFRHFRPP